MAERSFDVVVIGAGPAGEVAAGRLGEAGLEVAIVEEHLVGGECSYYACMPSKALLRPGDLMAEVGRVPGIRAAGPRRRGRARAARRGDPRPRRLGAAAVARAARRHARARDAAGSTARSASASATTRSSPARRSWSRPGAAPVMPPIPGLKEARPWGNRQATTAKVAPESLVILGGGVVGVELAQAWASLGTRVTVVEGLHRLISREEPFACEQVGAALREAGVDLRMGTRAASVSRERERHGRARGRDERERGGGARRRRPAAGDGGLGPRDDRARAGQGGRRRRRTCARPSTTGSTRSATPTAARCSRTWASTRRASPPT